MNHPQNKTFHFISTHHFPGLPLSDSDISIKGSVLENTNEKIFLRIKKFLNENKNASIDALVVTITDVIDQTEINEIKKLLPNLNHIATFAVGYNNIDTQHAKTLGIRVTNTPGVIAEATADIALTLLLCTTRRVAEGYDMLKKQGEFPGWSPNFLVGKGLQGKTLGIVGYGDIGKAFAKRAQSLGMHCVALRSLHENSTPNKEDENIARYPEDEFLKKCDVISLHVPSTKYTQNWLNKERILQMKKGSIVINAGRGDLVDELALTEALNTGHLYAAGLDVFCHEPILSEPLRTAKNIFILPHLGTATEETQSAMGQRIYETLKAHFIEKQGSLKLEALPFQVN